LIKDVAAELSELLNVSKYSMVFFFKGQEVKLFEKIGEKLIGSDSD
jgi:hypothetical protein